MTTTLRNARKYLADAAVDLPAEVAKIVDTFDALDAIKPSGALAELVADAEAGKLTPRTVAGRIADAAQARANAEAAAPIVNAVRTALERAALAALRRAHAEIIEALRPLFDQAVELYRAAHALGVAPGMSTEEAVKIAGTDGAVALARLDDAHAIMQRVSMARGVTTGQALDAQHMITLDTVQPATRSAGGFSDQWTSCLDRVGASAYKILVAGMTPHLNTDDEARQVKAKAEVPPVRELTADEKAEDARDDLRERRRRTA